MCASGALGLDLLSAGPAGAGVGPQCSAEETASVYQSLGFSPGKVKQRAHRLVSPQQGNISRDTCIQTLTPPIGTSP